MRMAILFLQKARQKDDIVQFDRVQSDPDRIRVTYRDGTARRRGTYQFYIAREAVNDYVSDLLFGLRHDAEPFEYVQVMTAITPSILYHVADLDDADIRSNIRTTVAAACNLHVTLSDLLMNA